jgi:hypothetical protein
MQGNASMTLSSGPKWQPTVFKDSFLEPRKTVNFFIRVQDETLCVAMRVRNPNRSRLGNQDASRTRIDLTAKRR